MPTCFFLPRRPRMRDVDWRRSWWLIWPGLVAAPAGAFVVRVLSDPVLLLMIAALAYFALVAGHLPALAQALTGRSGAVAAGAAAALVDRPVDGGPYVLVPDTLRGLEAHHAAEALAAAAVAVRQETLAAVSSRIDAVRGVQPGLVADERRRRSPGWFYDQRTYPRYDRG